MANDPTSPMSPASPTYRDDGLPHIFALVIGIDVYASPKHKNLKAAAGDADSFEKYLLEGLNIHPSCITNLRNEKATRAAIIAGFKDLRDDRRFRRDEAAIIIYFAGHGARIDKPQEWTDWETTGQQIEMMCPTDIDTLIPVFGKPGEEELVHGIPDRTVSFLLNHISDVKGNNVTLILDCCSSGGINRADVLQSQSPDCVPRQTSNLPPIHPNIDREILMHETRSAATANGFSGRFHASHVLLAACGKDQVAWEDPKSGHGIFTKGLLKTLESYGVDELTYSALMHKLDMPKWQTPHCEGQNVNRRLFNKESSGGDGSFILSQRQKTGELTLQAGAAQGITVGSTFGVYASNLVPDRKHPNAPLGILVVESVSAFSSKLLVVPGTTVSFPSRSSAFYSKLIERKSEKFLIQCDDRPWIEVVFPLMKREALSIEIIDDGDAAALRLSLVDGEFHLYRNDPMITPHIGAQMPHTIKPSDPDSVTQMQEVVERMIHFRYHLTRTGEDFQNVWMELRKLKIEYNVDFDQTLTPIEDNLITQEPATIVVDEVARLGMSIYNQTDLTLYPYLFYFDPKDLFIIEWYTPPFGAGAGRLTTAVDSPLPSKSHLTVGYGGSGVCPWQFLLRDGEDTDVGFFKLFLTTSPADFSSIAQDSPFETSISRHGKVAPAQLPEAERWGSKLSTVIQVRH